MPNIINLILPNIESGFKKSIVAFVQGDLRKVRSTYEIYKNEE